MSLTKRRLKAMQKISKKPSVYVAKMGHHKDLCDVCGKHTARLIYQNPIWRCVECHDRDQIALQQFPRRDWGYWD